MLLHRLFMTLIASLPPDFRNSIGIPHITLHDIHNTFHIRVYSIQYSILSRCQLLLGPIGIYNVFLHLKNDKRNFPSIKSMETNNV